MSRLDAAARAALRDADITQADWARAHSYEPAHWGGDVCGCPDDRCIGYHHHAYQSCGCLGVLIDSYDGPRKGRLRVYLEPRDAWIGVYVAKHAVFICPLPFIVIRWRRAHRRVKHIHGGWPWHGRRRPGMSDPPCAFTARYHRPRFYRYLVADPGFRVRRNRYTGQHGGATIGFAVVAGRWAYCAKWADAKVVPDE